MSNSGDSSKHGDIYAHLVKQPSPKIVCLAVVTGMVQALLLICVAIDYKSRWSSRWLAAAAGQMFSDNQELLLAMALCKVASLAGLTYYVHNEAQAAVALMLEVTGRRPATPGANTVAKANRNPFLALIPFWQLLLAIGTFGLQSLIFVGYYLPAGYGSLTINQDSAMITDVIFAAVALSFVLELDNKAYEMLQTTPESYSMASMYSALLARNSTMDILLPTVSSNGQYTFGRRCQMWMLWIKLWAGMLLEKLYSTWLGKAIWCVEIGCFHAMVMMYTSFVLGFSTTYVFDVFITPTPQPSDWPHMTLVLLLAAFFFIMFQLVLGVWLPPPESSTQACEEACIKAGRPFDPAQCNVCRWYALAGNIIIPVMTAVVTLVGHNTSNDISRKILDRAGVDCNLIVSVQLNKTGGANISCGNPNVDMMQFVTDTVNQHANVTGELMERFPICGMLGVRDVSICTSIWFLGLPVWAWSMSCLVLVVVPLLIISVRQQPCGGCTAGDDSMLPAVCECPAAVTHVGAEQSLVSVFAAGKFVEGLDGRKSA